MQIETLIVVIMENRSFDHMLGYLNLPGDKRIALEGLRSDAAWLASCANAGANGTLYQPSPMTDEQIPDPPHDTNSIKTQLQPETGGGFGLKGFVKSYEAAQPKDPRWVMGYYNDQQVRVFDFFARNYTVCDHWFSSVPCGTQPNRLMAMSGTTNIYDNENTLPDQDLVYDWLDHKNIDWCAYHSGDIPFFFLMDRWRREIFRSWAGLPAIGGKRRFRSFDKLRADWTSSDHLPPVIFIEPGYTDAGAIVPNDDHSPTPIIYGQQFLADIYNTLISNPPRWSHTAMIVLYDEHGGFFDHVQPVALKTPIDGDPGGRVFTSSGPRVPGFVISPWVDPGKPFSGVLDHTSVLQFIARNFGRCEYSEALTKRNAALSQLSDAITRSTPRPDAPPAPNPLRQFVGASAEAFRTAHQKMIAEHPELATARPDLLNFG